jgi:hypothetical protein
VPHTRGRADGDCAQLGGQEDRDREGALIHAGGTPPTRASPDGPVPLIASSSDPDPFSAGAQRGRAGAGAAADRGADAGVGVSAARALPPPLPALPPHQPAVRASLVDVQVNAVSAPGGESAEAERGPPAAASAGPGAAVGEIHPEWSDVDAAAAPATQRRNTVDELDDLVAATLERGHAHAAHDAAEAPGRDRDTRSG